MATPRPQRPVWPTPYREHDTKLGNYLQETLSCTERTNNQPVLAGLVKIIVHGTLALLLKYNGPLT